MCGRELTLQEPLQLGAVHVDVLHQLNVVNIHVVLCAHRQLLQPVETRHASATCARARPPQILLPAVSASVVKM